MVDDGATAARHELMVRMRDVLKAVRLFKNQQPPNHTVVPSGTLGVLAAIDNIEASTGCHSKDLAAQCALDPSTISRAVAALVRAGLVVRTADPRDGRASVLALTPKGRQVLGDTTRWYVDLLADALGDWTAPELTALADLLHRFSDDLIARFDARPTGPIDGPTPARNPYNTLEAAR